MAGDGGDEGKRWEGPLVSVVMPAYYGCAGTIERAIQSVLEQEVSLELIIVDDCSPDELNQVIDQYRGNTPVLRYVRNSENMGACKSRNRGVAMARGRYIAFLDADDLVGPRKTETGSVALSEESGEVLCSTGRQLMRPDGTDLGRYIGVPKKITYRMLLRQNVINCSSVLIERQAALEFPMSHEDSHADYITWIKVLEKYQTAGGCRSACDLCRLTDRGKLRK